MENVSVIFTSAFYISDMGKCADLTPNFLSLDTIIPNPPCPKPVDMRKQVLEPAAILPDSADYVTQYIYWPWEIGTSGQGCNWSLYRQSTGNDKNFPPFFSCFYPSSSFFIEGVLKSKKYLAKVDRKALKIGVD